jgi:hypothetical protein
MISSFVCVSASESWKDGLYIVAQEYYIPKIRILNCIVK